MLANIIFFILISSCIGYGFWAGLKYLRKQISIQEQIIKEFKDKVELDTQILQAKTNNIKGTIGELIGYIKLNANYDRVFPVNNVIDFIAIKFPKGTEEGSIDFIDIKNSSKPRLKRDQMLVQKLIKDKKITFIRVDIKTEVENDTSSKDSKEKIS